MSQDRRKPDYRRLADAQVGNVRRDGGGRSIGVVGYSPGGNGLAAKAVPGDQKFPFFKDVPDVEGPIQLRDGLVTAAAVVTNALPLVTSPYLAEDAVGGYERSPTIDVRGIRVATLVLDYYPGVSGQPPAALGELSLIFQHRIDPFNPTGTETAESQFRTTGVVDPTLNVPGIVQSYAMQRVYPRELRLSPSFTAAGDVATALGTPAPISLDFDVSRYDEIRWLWGDTVSAVGSLLARAYIMR